MKIQVKRDGDEIAATIVSKVKEIVKAKPNALICIAGGDTPKPALKQLVAANSAGEIDFSHCRFVGLDEWVGISGETYDSCFQTLNDYFFSQLENVTNENIYFFDGTADLMTAECDRINAFINSEGPLDYVLLGIGLNGHVGFNEPGADLTKEAHVIELDEVTKEVMGKYFEQKLPLEQGVTLGFSQLLASKHVDLVATGEHKAVIVEQTVNEPISASIPSTVMRQSLHEVRLLLDDQAAIKLKNE